LLRSKISLEEFLEIKPKRRDFRWIEEEEKVRIIVPKFKSSIGKKFCRLLKRDVNFTVNLDRIGSEVWKMCDGEKKVNEILKHLERKFPQEKQLKERLFCYLYTLKRLNYIDFL